MSAYDILQVGGEENIHQVTGAVCGAELQGRFSAQQKTGCLA